MIRSTQNEWVKVVAVAGRAVIVLPSSPLCVALELLVGTVGVVQRRLIEYHCNCVLSPSWVGGAAARRFHLCAFCWFAVDLLL